MSAISPKGYQEDAVNNALEIFTYAENQLQQANDGQSRLTISAYNGCVLLEAPTGAGKTLMAGLIAEQFSRTAKVVWFWFTPFSNLVEQAKSALKKDFNGLKIRDLGHERVAYKIGSGDVFVTTWASVAASNATTRILRKNGDSSLSLDEFILELRNDNFRIGVVIDEAHHTFTKTSEAVKFYRNIMSPEFSLLITATPNDADVDKFKTAAGLAEIHKIQVSREDAVVAGVIKEAVKSIVYLVPDNQQQMVDLELTALEDGWQTHQAIKNELVNSTINLMPLMLVQIDSKGKAGAMDVEKTKQRLIDLGVPEEAIAWYTADDPNDDLSLMARDERKQVLIFKVAAALGFDAPRAFTLVSLRTSKAVDFGIQVVGRILRVHQKLQLQAAAKSLPNLLRFGYVFLADAENQGGLIGAAGRINAIKTQMSAITPYTLLVKFAGQTEVQVSQNGQLSLLPNPYIRPDWETNPATKNDDGFIPHNPGRENPTLLDTLMGEVVEPITHQVEETQSLGYRPCAVGNRFFPLRDNVPTRFISERIPLMVGLAEQIVAQIRLDAEVLVAGLRKNIKISRQTINIFDQTDQQIEKHHAKLSANEMARRAQLVLFDAQFIDVKALNNALLKRLKLEYIDQYGHELSELDLIRTLNMIIVAYPKLIRNATKTYLSEFKEIFKADELLKQIEASESIDRANLNSYGIIPSDLNETERQFARILEADTSKTVRWWHRNKDRKPYSVGIVLPNGNRYFPDFIIGVNNRTKGEGILLVETKGGFIADNVDTQDKIHAEHKVYGKSIMLTLQDDGQFWLMQCLESDNKVKKDQPFRVENMCQY
jgi:type III restriction enzyme